MTDRRIAAAIADFQRKHPDRVTNADGSKLAPLVKSRLRDLAAPAQEPMAPATPKTVPDFALLIAGRFPSLNDILRVKANRWKGTWNKMKVEWQSLVRRAWEGAGKPKVMTAYHVRYLYVVSDKRRDLSNIHAAAEKIILDALVNAGALPGDGAKWHQGSSYTPHHDKSMDAVKIHVVGVDSQF